MGNVHVDTTVLTTRASEMLAMPWKTSVSQAQAPDSVPLSVTAVANLNDCANSLMAYQNCGKAQSERLAGMLNDTARQYQNVDTEYAGRMDDPGRLTKVNAIAVPPPSTPPPTLPDAPKPPAMVSAAGYSTVEQNDQQLNSGPGTGALESASTDYKDAANMLANVEAPHFENWEGTAATAAMDRFKELYTWLGELSAKWTALAAAADEMKKAHDTAVAEHAPILQSYKEYFKELMRLYNNNGDPAQIELITRILAKLQQDSNDVLEKYARSASFSPPNVSDPPFASGRAGSSSAGPNSGKEAGPNEKGGGGGGEGKDSKGDSPRVSPASADPSAAQQKSAAPAGGGSPAGGGAPAGGAPSGAGAGGAPSGGMPGGMPNMGKPTLPKLNEPSLKPASLGGGGGAKGGGGGGGGGGGMPKMPLGPAVGSESVAPTPAAAKAGGQGTAGPAPAGAGMGGGGMGGGGMGHGGGQQGKEKRRDPNLSPDEDLYKEDRAWTEPVIGRQNQPRRKGSPDGKDSGS